MKWVEFLQRNILKHENEKSNRVVNALSRRQLLLTEMEIEVVGFNELSNLNLEDRYFSEALKAFIEYVTLDKKKW